MNTPELSVISPVYMGQEMVIPLIEEITAAADKITSNFEIVLVEDGSPDNSWAAIVGACRRFPFVRGIKLSRNFGQHYAITAGLQAARGNFVAVLDCDLQEDPKYLVEMYAKALEGHDIVFAHKKQRQHSVFKNLTASLYTRVFNWLVANPRFSTNSQVGSFTLLSRKALDSFLQVKDYHRHYLLILRWIGFQTAAIEVEHRHRRHGKSSYNFTKLVKHAIDGITSQTDSLLYIALKVGAVYLALSVLGVLALIVLYFTHGFMEGWPSIVVLLLLSTGINLLFTGIVGIYVGRAFEQTKDRPLYIIDQRINFED